MRRRHQVRRWGDSVQAGRTELSPAQSTPPTHLLCEGCIASREPRVALVLLLLLTRTQQLSPWCWCTGGFSLLHCCTLPTWQGCWMA